MVRQSLLQVEAHFDQEEPVSRFAPISRGRKAVKRTVSTVALAAAVTVCAAPAAQANTYKVYVCKTPDGKPIPLDRNQWTPTISQNYSTAVEGCAGGNALALYMGSPPVFASYPAGPVASWKLRAPVAFSGVRAWRSLSSRHIAGDDNATPEYQVTANGRALETCATTSYCQYGSHGAGEAPQNEVRWAFAPTSLFEIFLHCGGSGWCANGGGERLTAAFTRFEFDAVDNTAPYFEPSSLTGTLITEGEQRGSKSVSVKAQDWGSGLYEVVASIDGVPVARFQDLNNGRCKRVGAAAVPDYREFQPCTTLPTVADLMLDTSKFKDGEHALKVEAVDAAGNTTLIKELPVRFFNAPKNTTKPTITTKGVAGLVGPVIDPRPGDTLTASPGRWDGEGVQLTYQWENSADGVGWGPIANAVSPGYTIVKGDVKKHLRVTVKAANPSGSEVTASEATVKVNSGETIDPKDYDPVPNDPTNGGGGDVSTAQLVVDREQRTVEVRHGAKIVITGRLVDAESQPIADAEVDVFEQLALTAAPWAKIGTVKTDSQGGYIYRPKTTASRRLRFAYADRRDASNYRATREVFISVAAGMSISAKRQVLRPGQTIRLRGRVTVDNLPETGTWVEVQVLDAGVWRTVATRKTSSKGLWTFKHRLRQSAGVTFRFRSRLRVVGDVASAESKSTPVKVRIR